MQVVYSQTSAKQLKKLPKNTQVKTLQIINKLKQNPLSGKPLQGGSKHLRSLRIWPYRIVYLFNSNNQTIFINVIQHRKDVYK